MGYRAINNYLSREKHAGDSKYRQQHLMMKPKAVNVEGLCIKDIIQAFRSGMTKTTQKESAETYYRGANCESSQSYRNETFMSLTTDKEEAMSYKNTGCLYKVKIDTGILFMSYGKNEAEYVLVDGCYWEYIKYHPKEEYHEVRVHGPDWSPPPSSHYPWLGDLSLPSNEKPKEKTEEKVKSLMNQLDEEEPINWNADGGRTRKNRRRRTKRAPYRVRSRKYPSIRNRKHSRT